MTEVVPADLTMSAQWLVQALDPPSDLTRLVRLDAAAYRQASFLDDRLFIAEREVVVRPWAEVAQAAERLNRDDARWIFHIGHVGSTLLARLLGELPDVLSVREPRILRDVTTLETERRRPMFRPLQKLLSRSFHAGQAALVKATSFASELATELVAPAGSALMMYAGPRSYIETILAGPNSIKELQHLAESRAQRLHKCIPSLPQATSNADLAALAWACEMTALERAVDTMPVGMQWLDFDALLEDMPGRLMEVARGFAFDASAANIRRIAHGPLTQRYSKDQAYAYSSALRSELRSEARRKNRREIECALGLLHEMAENAPLLARAMQRASR